MGKPFQKESGMSNKERNDHYIQFPLCLLQETYKDPVEGLNIIFDYGIVHYAKKIRYNIEEVGRQLMYDYYRKQDMIQWQLVNMMEQYIESEDLIIDDNYFGFTNSGTDFEPLEGSGLLELFEADQNFKEAAIFHYQIKQATSSLNISISNIEVIIKRYDKGIALQSKFEQLFGSDAMPMVKTSHLFDYLKNPKDLDLFRAYIAIRSMIGQRNFATTQKPAILGRMVGCKSVEAFKYFTEHKTFKNKYLLPTVEKYSKRYQMDKLLFTLAERKFIMYLSKPKVSVIYVSIYMEPEALAKLIIKSKDKLNLKKRLKDAAASL